MITPVFEVATLRELADWFRRSPSSVLLKLLVASAQEEKEVIRKSGATWLIDVQFALKHYKPQGERPVYYE